MSGEMTERENHVKLQLENEPKQYVISSDVVCITPPSRISGSRVTVVRRHVAMEWEDFLESEHHY